MVKTGVILFNNHLHLVVVVVEPPE
eukprot:COSAG02_NODE_51890_length_311_cov_0.740566_1_plen_24_part_10